MESMGGQAGFYRIQLRRQFPWQPPCHVWNFCSPRNLANCWKWSILASSTATLSHGTWGESSTTLNWRADIFPARYTTVINVLFKMCLCLLKTINIGKNENYFFQTKEKKGFK